VHNYHQTSIISFLDILHKNTESECKLSGGLEVIRSQLFFSSIKKRCQHWEVSSNSDYLWFGWTTIL